MSGHRLLEAGLAALSAALDDLGTVNRWREKVVSVGRALQAGVPLPPQLPHQCFLLILTGGGGAVGDDVVLELVMAAPRDVAVVVVLGVDPASGDATYVFAAGASVGALRVAPDLGDRVLRSLHRDPHGSDDVAFQCLQCPGRRAAHEVQPLEGRAHPSHSVAGTSDTKEPTPRRVSTTPFVDEELDRCPDGDGADVGKVVLQRARCKAVHTWIERRANQSRMSGATTWRLGRSVLRRDA